MISIIAAIGRNGELGKNNSLIWNIPGDLKFFKEITLNHKVIMGLNTYNSIGRELPKRKNVVLTDDLTKVCNDKVILYDNLEELIKKELNNNEENFIIGGASLYNYFYNYADRMYLTLIAEEDKEADTYFPKIQDNFWKQTELGKNEDNNIKYKHVLFERIK